jgi:hypothetical protein
VDTDNGRCQASLVKAGERFLVRCDAGSEEAAIAQLMRWAEDPDLGFDWFDAAVLARQINQQLLERAMGSAGADLEAHQRPHS